MTRVKRGKISMKRRRNVLRQVKGFRNKRGSKERQAREALVKAGSHAFAHRKDKKNDFRHLWTVRMTAALGKHDLSYSKFMGMMKKKSVALNRKMLATLAEEYPAVFDRLVKEISK